MCRQFFSTSYFELDLSIWSVLLKTFDTIWFRTENLFCVFFIVPFNIMIFYLLAEKININSHIIFSLRSSHVAKIIRSIILCWSLTIRFWKAFKISIFPSDIISYLVIHPYTESVDSRYYIKVHLLRSTISFQFAVSS